MTEATQEKPATQTLGAKDLALALGVEAPIVRRHLRKLGITTTEGTYKWKSGSEFNGVVKKVKAALEPAKE